MSFYATIFENALRNRPSLALGIIALTFCFGFDAFACGVALGEDTEAKRVV